MIKFDTKLLIAGAAAGTLLLGCQERGDENGQEADYRFQQEASDRTDVPGTPEGAGTGGSGLEGEGEPIQTSPDGDRVTDPRMEPGADMPPGSGDPAGMGDPATGGSGAADELTQPTEADGFDSADGVTGTEEGGEADGTSTGTSGTQGQADPSGY